MGVPLAVWLALLDFLLTDRSISEQMVDELYREHFDLFKLFEKWNVYVVSFRNVQEHTIDEKQECFYVQELAPWKTQIEEELRQSLIVNAHFVHSDLLLLPGLLFLLTTGI